MRTTGRLKVGSLIILFLIYLSYAGELVTRVNVMRGGDIV